MSKVSLRGMRLARRKRRTRKKISGVAECPRLSVFRSLHHVSVQAVDDVSGRTVAAAGTMEKELALKSPAGNAAAAAVVGKAIAERLIKQGVKKVVFDRNGRPYHGRIKALAEAARAGGLQF